MPLVHPLVAEDPADLEHPVEAADDETLEVQLKGDPQVELHVERVVMRPERARRGAARHRLQHGSLDLDKAACLQECPRLLDDAASCQENLHHLRIRDQVEVALAVAQLLVLEPVILLG